MRDNGIRVIGESQIYIDIGELNDMDEEKMKMTEQGQDTPAVEDTATEQAAAVTETAAPIAPDPEAERLAAEKAADEEAMKTAIFIGLALGCLIGAVIGSLSKGLPIGIAVAVIVELILKRRRKKWREEEREENGEE